MLTVGAAVTAGGAGTIGLTSTGATNDIDINAAVSSTSGAITATSGRNIAFGASGDVSTSTSAGGANVTLTGSNTGTITEAGTNTTVTGNGLALSAGGGIGTSGNPIVMNGTTLTANSSANNNAQFLKDIATIGLNTTNALNAGSGNINLVGGTFQIQAGAVTGGSSTNAITDTSPLVITSPGSLDLNGFSEKVTTLSGNGTVTSSAAGKTGEIQIGVNNGTGATFSGVIQDGGGTALTAVRKIGTGTQTLTGVNTYTGVTNIDLGTLTLGAGGVINNNGATTAGLVNLNTAGVILNGSGTIKGQVTVVASTSANETQIQAVTVTLPTTAGGTGITVETGATVAQIGTTAGVTVNGGNATSTGLAAQSGAAPSSRTARSPPRTSACSSMAASLR